jgi:hypothetical protein
MRITAGVLAGAFGRSVLYRTEQMMGEGYTDLVTPIICDGAAGFGTLYAILRRNELMGEKLRI